MYFDSLTWTAIAINFVILIVIIRLIHNSNREHRASIRRIATQYALVLGSEDAIKICKAIKKINPDACPGLDYSLQINSNGDANIAEWNQMQAAPTKEQLMDAIRMLEDNRT